MGNEMELRVGHNVRHRTMQEWGPGRVLGHEEEGKVKIFFVDAGQIKVMKADGEYLEIIGADDPALVALDGIDFEIALKAPKFKSVKMAIVQFLRNYEGGFEGHRFISEERDYKERTCAKAPKLIGKDRLEPLMQSEQYAAVLEAVNKAIRLDSDSGQIAGWRELDLFVKASKQVENQRALAMAVYALLHGEGELSVRFAQWCEALDRVGAAKWPIATLPLFVLFPDSHIPVKPSVVKEAAEACGQNINYEPTPNWRTYSSILRFAEFLRKPLAPLGARDMIDIQSFMWGIAPDTHKQ